MAPTKSKSKQRPKKIGAVIAKEEDDDSKPGCIYLGHIPHGFYEDQMRDYFSQFGQVLGVRICRSKKNGNSKGYGFVKFKFSAVAKTVAETCNNYLFFNKLLKCEFKPMSEIHKNTFKSWNQKFFPKVLPRRQYNNDKTDVQLIESMKKTLSKAEKKMEKLRAAGLEADLKDILDIPDPTVFPTTPKSEQRLKRKEAEAADEESSAAEDEPRTKRKKTNASTPTIDTPPAKASKKSPVSVKITPTIATPAKISKKSPASGKTTPKVATPANVSKKSPASVKSTPVVTTPAKTSKKSPSLSSSDKKSLTPKATTPKRKRKSLT